MCGDVDTFPPPPYSLPIYLFLLPFLSFLLSFTATLLHLFLYLGYPCPTLAAKFKIIINTLLNGHPAVNLESAVCRYARRGPCSFSLAGFVYQAVRTQSRAVLAPGYFGLLVVLAYRLSFFLLSYYTCLSLSLPICLSILSLSLPFASFPQCCLTN